MGDPKDKSLESSKPKDLGKISTVNGTINLDEITSKAPAGDIFSGMISQIPKAAFDETTSFQRWMAGTSTYEAAVEKGYAPSKEQIDTISKVVKKDVNALYADKMFRALDDKDAIQKCLNVIFDSMEKCAADNKWEGKWCKKNGIEDMRTACLKPEIADHLIFEHRIAKKGPIVDPQDKSANQIEVKVPNKIPQNKLGAGNSLQK